jgi:thioredoxin reductase (NADPH)
MTRAPGVDGSVDVLVVGGGPTGIAVGAEATRQGLSTLLVERGSLAQALVDFPLDMTFFSTRELLEIADVPFAVVEDKPNRRQALRYYHAVAARYRLPLALHHEVTAVRPERDGFAVTARDATGRVVVLRASAVVVATGYFGQPRSLGVPGEQQDWISLRYREAYPHFGERVVVVGGGNGACEAALELWRNGARVTLVHRQDQLKPTLKYWVRPDIENRIREGSIAARMACAVTGFGNHDVELRHADGSLESLPVDAAYVLVGYLPEVRLLVEAGVAVDPETLVPAVDGESCESNVPGLYIAGTLQAGRDTHRIFIENSRGHAVAIARHVAARLHAAV